MEPRGIRTGEKFEDLRWNWIGGILIWKISDCHLGWKYEYFCIYCI